MSLAIDDIIAEPSSGTHRDKSEASKALGAYIVNTLNELEKMPMDELHWARVKKLLNVGAFKEEAQNT